MPFGGIIWATIFCVPFWIALFVLVRSGFIAIEAIIFFGMVFLALLLLILLMPRRIREEDDQQLLRLLMEQDLDSAETLTRGLELADNGGTRSGIERRQYEYTAPIPEKRSGNARRNGVDRRSGISPRKTSERRSIFRTQS